jgi:hypothetical protein
MKKDLMNRIIVAASAAKLGGFDGTYCALMELSKALKQTEGDRISLSSYVAYDQKRTGYLL